jgi:serpin B
MEVIIPKTGTVNDLINSLTPEKWIGWLHGMRYSLLSVEMPRMNLECDYSLIPPLKNMGLEIAFSRSANFKGINPDVSLAISDVIHKTFINVDENGTEAAALTAVRMMLTMADNTPTPIPFLMNKPFLLAITEKSTGAILFIGA